MATSRSLSGYLFTSNINPFQRTLQRINLISASWHPIHLKLCPFFQLPESAGGVRTIYPQRPGRNDGNIYVGTTRNNILEGSLQRRFNQVVFGHGRQLWGLAAHPEDEIFATAGHDKHIALWRKQKLLWTMQSGYECVSLAFHPFGQALAAGSTEGHLLVINSENGAAMLTLRVCGSPLNCIAYNQGIMICWPRWMLCEFQIGIAEGIPVFKIPLKQSKYCIKRNFSFHHASFHDSNGQCNPILW